MNDCGDGLVVAWGDGSVLGFGGDRVGLGVGDRMVAPVVVIAVGCGGGMGMVVGGLVHWHGSGRAMWLPCGVGPVGMMSFWWAQGWHGSWLQPWLQTFRP